MKLEHEILKRNDGNWAVCEYRWLDHSLNTKQIFVSGLKKECMEYLKEYRKKNKQ